MIEFDRERMGAVLLDAPKPEKNAESFPTKSYSLTPLGARHTIEPLSPRRSTAVAPRRLEAHSKSNLLKEIWGIDAAVVVASLFTFGQGAAFAIFALSS